MMKALAPVLIALAAWAASDDDPVEVLLRVRANVEAHGRRIPNHTCVETIDRDTYGYVPAPPPKSCDTLLERRKPAEAATLLRLSASDRLRLDVGISGAHEIYSWAGAPRFEEPDIDQFVPGLPPFTNAKWSYLGGLANGLNSDILLFVSPFGPQFITSAMQGGHTTIATASLPSPVPEPSSVTFIVSGLLSLLAAVQLRKRRAA